MAWPAIVAGPLMVYTAELISYPASPPGFWAWWLAGLVYLGLPILLSTGASSVAFMTACKMRDRATA